MSDTQWIRELNWSLEQQFKPPDTLWWKVGEELRQDPSVRGQAIWGIYALPRAKLNRITKSIESREYSIVANPQFFFPTDIAVSGLTYEEAEAFKKIMDSNLQGG